MLSIDKRILYWFTFIIASLVVASTLGLVGMYGTVSIITEKTLSNEKRLTDIVEYHNHDVKLIRDNIRDIKSDQQIIKNDVKLILRKID